MFFVCVFVNTFFSLHPRIILKVARSFFPLSVHVLRSPRCSLSITACAQQSRPDVPPTPPPASPPRRPPRLFFALLQPCSLALQISRVLNVEGGDLEAVKKKFSSSKFGSVASMKVNVLPDDLL